MNEIEQMVSNLRVVEMCAACIVSIRAEVDINRYLLQSYLNHRTRSEPRWEQNYIHARRAAWPF
jgi:hypothetical protein